jgi:hypothetical protein
MSPSLEVSFPPKGRLCLDVLPTMSLTLQTDIWLVVRVPVLSEQMTEVHPRVSTDGKLLTMAFFFAIRRVPKARQVVITAGRPEGREGPG